MNEEKDMVTSEEKTSSDDSVLKSARNFVLIILMAVLCFYALMSNSKNNGQVLPMIFGKGCAIICRYTYI